MTRSRKNDHWRTVAIEAIKQCGSARLPHIEAPVTPEAFLARQEVFDLSLIASLEADSVHPREHFRAFERHAPKTAEHLRLVGPGRFTSAEIAAVKSAGARHYPRQARAQV
jgi:16S rRNA (uracil1498-N3)-methyltransferase